MEDWLVEMVEAARLANINASTPCRTASTFAPSSGNRHGAQR